MPEGILYLLLLIKKLSIVGQVLPFASAANPKVLTKGLGTLVRITVVIYHPRFHVTPFLPEYLEVANISGDGFLHKDHHVIDPGKGFAFSPDIFNGNLL